jgi:hypothetical protein
MSSLPANHQPSTFKGSFAAPSAARVTAEARVAANDDLTATPNYLRNPLWIIAIGMACFFVVAAAVMALG